MKISLCSGCPVELDLQQLIICKVNIFIQIKISLFFNILPEGGRGINYPFRNVSPCILSLPEGRCFLRYLPPVKRKQYL